MNQTDKQVQAADPRIHLMEGQYTGGAWLSNDGVWKFLPFGGLWWSSPADDPSVEATIRHESLAEAVTARLGAYQG